MTKLLYNNQLLLILGVVTIYVFAAVAGLAFAFLPGVFVVGPPVGIALASLLILGLALLTATACSERRRAKDARRHGEDLRANEQLLRKLLHLQEQERKSLAYEIHDGLMQYMVGAQMSLEGIRRNIQPADEETIENMNWSRDLIGKAINEARQLISELRPPIIDELGIVEAIRYLIDDVTNKSEISVRFLPITEFCQLPPLLEGNVFRIVQEALMNVRRHSQASDAEIKLFQDASTLQIRIHDNGIGFDPDDIEENRFGVESIIKRARLFGGQAEIASSPGEGTKIDVVLPLNLPTVDERPETAKPGPDALSQPGPTSPDASIVQDFEPK